MRLTRLCGALLLLDVAYLALALFTPGLPGWKMFDVSVHATYSLRDADGRALDAYAFVPRAARALDHADLARVARFACERRLAPLPLVLDTPRLHRTFSAPDCAPHALP